MLKVVATDDDGNVVAELEITRVDTGGPNATVGQYSVRAAVAEPEGTRFTQRNFRHPRLKANYIGLLELALLTLDDGIKDFENEVSASDMAGRLDRGVPEIQAWPSELYHN